MLFNNKGITPVISVILLLMMTISIAGLAYTWLQRTQASIETSTENTTERLLGSLKVQLRVEGYNLGCNAGSSNLTISVRNAGTEKAKNLQVYIDDAIQTGMTNSSLDPGTIINFNATVDCTNYVNSTKTIKITSDESTAEKTFSFTCTTGSC
ncbi:MAG: archaellin/type IV pilin N-terminal domain-containing protein [Candidatus Undinarchaeales archaeon]